MTKNRYVIAEGPDGIFWLSLQPLLHDVTERLDAAREHNDPHVIHAMENVRAFISALISEGNTQKYMREREVNTETPYKDTLQ